MRPLLYGFVLYIVLKQEETENIRRPELRQGSLTEEIAAIQKEELTNGQLEEFFRQKGLTAREMEIALLARKGLSNREMGEQLYISETTVKKHMSNLFEKLELENREQLKHL